MKLLTSVIIPALNEEKNIIAVIDDTLTAFYDFGIEGEIIVINDGSTDNTPKLVKQKMESDSRIRMLSHKEPMGIGASFWDGVENAKGDAVLMLPGDNENDPKEILRYLDLLKDVDIVIPFVFNKEVRSRLRNFLSSVYHFIINTTFLLSLKYTNGTVLYRKSLLEELNNRNSSFFFQTDILVRLLKRGYLFIEVPYKLRKRGDGKSKAINSRSLREVARSFTRLFGDMYFKKENKLNRYQFNKNSVSSQRYKN